MRSGDAVNNTREGVISRNMTYHRLYSVMGVLAGDVGELAGGGTPRAHFENPS